MFERYTQTARRAVFFARYEASQLGSPYFETEHLLLGILREDGALALRFLGSSEVVDSIRKQIDARATTREKIPLHADIPVTDESKRALSHADDESTRMNHRHIGTEHLLLGLLREEKCFAAELLRERGLTLAQVRAAIQSSSWSPAEP